ncbi:MAG: hypothetical protein AAGC70_11405 [Pseudomonadota bacterium]
MTNLTPSAARLPVTSRNAQRPSRWPPLIWPFVMFLLVLAATGPNSLLALAATIVLVLGCAMLWRPGEPPILLYIFCFQWLQVSLLVFTANMNGVSVGEFSSFGDVEETAIWLSLVGLLIVAAGMRLAVGRWQAGELALARVQIQRTRQLKWLLLYVLALMASMIAKELEETVSGLAQPLQAVGALKWTFFVIFTFASFVRADASKLVWFAVFATEFGLSLGSYFSDFRHVIIYAVLGMVAAGTRFSPLTATGLAIVAATTLALGIVWTAIKSDFRHFVSGGQRAQIVTVDHSERLNKLWELTQELDSARLGEAANELAQRVSYTGFFAATIEYVPRFVAHENGAIWLDAVARPFMPRMFFPEKSAIDDSARTNKYTGLGVAGQEQGTSISIGYFGEAYIDFGRYGMMMILFAAGLVFGLIYRWALRGRYSRGVLGTGLAPALLIPAAAFETSVTKLAGSLVVSVIVIWLFCRFVVPALAPWLQKE